MERAMTAPVDRLAAGNHDVLSQRNSIRNTPPTLKSECQHEHR
jgi:hypothetical protein